ncbi:MAG: EVE domain-containing protein [Erysipelothrix sp.]
MNRRYWIGVASFEHVKLGVESGFSQVCHGKKAPLKRMKQNDIIFYYSPTLKFGSKEKYQCFTAMGRFIDDEVYQFEMPKNFFPYRRNVDFYQPLKHASIHTLIPNLDFIDNPSRYGEKFRFGLFEITHHDALVIWNAMKAS